MGRNLTSCRKQGFQGCDKFSQYNEYKFALCSIIRTCDVTMLLFTVELRRCNIRVTCRFLQPLQQLPSFFRHFSHSSFATCPFLFFLLPFSHGTIPHSMNMHKGAYVKVCSLAVALSRSLAHRPCPFLSSLSPWFFHAPSYLYS